MLPERLTQLLTAYIDGELSSRQRRAVTRLLRKSPEARKLLDEMQQDSIVLRHLPRKKMKQDLSQTLPGTIEMRGLNLPPPPPTAPLPRPATVPIWAALLVGGIMLGGLGLGSYVFFSAGQKKPSTPAATQRSSEPVSAPTPGTPGTRSRS
jgi:anti-sigma factor RsiW